MSGYGFALMCVACGFLLGASKDVTPTVGRVVFAITFAVGILLHWQGK
jgi:hypothetical protein